LRQYWDETTRTWFLYYSPNDIVFTEPQCLFLLEHKEVLEQGKYPSEPKGEYTEMTSEKTIRPSWNSPSNINAELDFRLSGVPEDAREALLHEAPRLDYLSKPALRALKYISGWHRKEEPFRQWKYDQKRRQKSVLGIDKEKGVRDRTTERTVKPSKRVSKVISFNNGYNRRQRRHLELKESDRVVRNKPYENKG